MKMVDEALIGFMQDFILSNVQLQELARLFGAEIAKGLSRTTNASADIKCLPTYVQELPTGNELGRYLALDLGGTNFRVLLVTLKGAHEAKVDSMTYAVSKELMVGPGVQLFDHIADCLAKFVKERQVDAQMLPLGFTFSFPCQQMGLTKALLMRWTKSFKCAGVEGKDVGQLLREAIRRRGDLHINVMAVLNDTTGTLMSCAHRTPECRIGVIIGTGCNACYVENVSSIDMLEEEQKQCDKQMIINTEWGAFGENGQLEFVRTDYDRLIDRSTMNEGKQLFEKMISGMYLGQLVRAVLLAAIEKKLLFKEYRDRQCISNVLQQSNEAFQTKYLSDIEKDVAPNFIETQRILKENFNISQSTIEDCEKLKFICECISKRAATLVSVAISGLINRINCPKTVVGVDGSVYRLHPKFDAYMRVVMRKFVKKGLDFDLMLSEDGSGRGAALVAAVCAK